MTISDYFVFAIVVGTFGTLIYYLSFYKEEFNFWAIMGILLLNLVIQLSYLRHP